MGLGLYVKLERDLAGVDPLAIDGKSLARAQFVLDRVAAAAQLPTIRAMLCADRQEAIDFLEDIGVDPDEVKLDEEKWYPPAEGRRCVHGLLAHLREVPDQVAQSERVIADLEAMDKVLRVAEQQQVRFHFALDLPL